MENPIPDYQLIQAVQQTGDNQAMSQLLDRVTGVYLDLINRSLPPEYDLIKRELAEDRNYNIYNCVMSYDPTRNMKFPTWVGQNIKWKCLNIYNRTDMSASLDDNSVEGSYEQEIENIQEKVLDEIKSFADNYPDERAKYIVEQRYTKCQKPTPWKKISLDLQIKECQCQTIHKKFLNHIKPKLKKYV